MGDAVSPIEWAVRMTLLGGRINQSVVDSNIIEPKSPDEKQNKSSLLSQESILMQKVEVTNDARKSFFADWLTQSGIH